MRYEIIVDSGETPNKCTIAPLSDRPDFHLFPVFGEGKLGPLSAPILLHHEGVCLSSLSRHAKPVAALASIDCVWRRLPRILGRIQWANQTPVLARIPTGFKTAYPRVGQPNRDPTGGLATIEAIFIAAAFFGRWDPTLLSKYYFAHRFIRFNEQRFLDLGIRPTICLEEFSRPVPRARDSYSRRRERGRLPTT